MRPCSLWCKWNHIKSVAPNDDTHLAFGKALRTAAAAGVHILAYDCTVTPNSIAIRNSVPVILSAKEIHNHELS